MPDSPTSMSYETFQVRSTSAPPISTWPPAGFFEEIEFANRFVQRPPHVPVMSSYAPVSTPCPISVVRSTPGVSVVHINDRPILAAPPIVTVADSYNGYATYRPGFVPSGPPRAPPVPNSIRLECPLGPELRTGPS